MQPTMRFLLVGSLALLAACGGDNGTTPQGVRVTVSPATVTLHPGDTQQFVAAVTGTDSTSVTWSVAAGPGTITQSGLYTAPASIDQSPTSARVRATSIVDPSASDEATVTLTQESGAVTVTVSPASVTLTVGQTQQFTATVTGAANTAVTWSVVSGPGNISTAGLYTAPGSITQASEQAVVRAVSQADPTASGSATVTVTQGTSSEATAILPGYVTSQDVHELGEANAVLCVEAVYLASELTGGQVLVTTGTLTEGPGGSFTYSASPADRLRIVFSSGGQIELFVTAFDGDFSQDADSFLYYDHDVGFRVVIQGALDLSIATTSSGSASTASLAGTYVYENVTYSANLTEQGSFSYSVESGSAEYEHQQSTNGSITAPGFSMTVNESYWYHSLYVTQFVENMERIVNNTWTSGGTSYQLSNVRIRKSFVDAHPSELDTYWIAQGALLKNGATYGQVGAGVEGIQVKIWLDTPSERIELEAWNL